MKVSFLCFTQWCYYAGVCPLLHILHPRRGFFVKFFQLKRVPKKSGTGVNSSDVDKRTGLIPCRCVSKLCERTLRCPRRREREEISMKYERNTSVTQYSWFWLSLRCSKEGRRRQPGNTCTKFSLFGITVVMQNVCQSS